MKNAHTHTHEIRSESNVSNIFLQKVQNTENIVIASDEQDPALVKVIYFSVVVRTV